MWSWAQVLCTLIPGAIIGVCVSAIAGYCAYTLLYMFISLCIYTCTRLARRLQIAQQRVGRVEQSARNDKGDIEGGEPLVEPNIPWTQYRHPLIPERSIRQQVVLCENTVEDALLGVLTMPQCEVLTGIVISSPGMYRCTEGPGCLYNGLSSVLPAGGLAVLQIISRKRSPSTSDLENDLSDAVRYLSSGPLHRQFRGVGIVLIGWSAGGAAVIEAAYRHTSEHPSAARSNSWREEARLISNRVCERISGRAGVCGLVTLASVPWGLKNISKLHVPMLIVHGQCDAILPASWAPQIAKKVSDPKQVQTLILSSATHCLEDPELISHIAAWLVPVFKLARNNAELVKNRANEWAIQKQSQLCVNSLVELSSAESSGVWVQLPISPGWNFVREGICGRIVAGPDFSQGPDEPRFQVKLVGGGYAVVSPQMLKNSSDH